MLDFSDAYRGIRFAARLVIHIIYSGRHCLWLGFRFHVTWRFSPMFFAFSTKHSYSTSPAVTPSHSDVTRATRSSRLSVMLMTCRGKKGFKWRGNKYSASKHKETNTSYTATYQMTLPRQWGNVNIELESGRHSQQSSHASPHYVYTHHEPLIRLEYSWMSPPLLHVMGFPRQALEWVGGRRFKFIEFYVFDVFR